jgi:hypothetical protein
MENGAYMTSRMRAFHRFSFFLPWHLNGSVPSPARADEYAVDEYDEYAATHARVGIGKKQRY